MPTTDTHRRRMPPADAAWLHMDRPTNLMVINSVWLLDEPIDPQRWRRVIAERLVAPYPRFRQRVVEPRLRLGTPHWENDPGFDLDHHMHRRGLSQPGDETALQELIGDLMATPLDHAKPLWDMYLIDGPGSGCAVYTRMHHCIADGISLARVSLALTDTVADGDRFDGWLSPRSDPARGRLGAITAPVRATASVASTTAREGLRALAHPGRAVDLGAFAARELSALTRLVFLSRDSDTSLRGDLGTSRKVAWTSPLPLQQIKDIAHAQGATVNDVLLAAISGALRSYLVSQGEAPQRIRALVPFNLRPADRPIPRELGNHFGLVFLDLPVDVANRRGRLRDVKTGMTTIKESPDGPLTYVVLEAMGLAPPKIETLGIDMFSAKASAVMTNVPGPREPIYLAGSRVGAVLVWAPTSGSVGMSISILSYNGEVTVGLMVDAHLVPEPQRIVDELGREVAAMARLAAKARKAVEPTAS